MLGGGFLNWDDDVNVLGNPHYRGLGWAQLRWMFTTTLLGHYIPLTWMSFGLNYLLGGMSPWGYHLGNLLLHAANAGLFYFVARRLLAAAFGGGGGSGGGRAEPGTILSLGAAFAALAFGVHPLRVESVAWVTERRDVLCGFFFLLATLAYLRGVAGGGAIERRWRALSLGAFLLALLSKAAAMPLPAVLLLVDVYPLRRVATVGWRRLLSEKIFYAALAGAGAVVALVAVRKGTAVTGYGEYGVGARVAMTAYSLIFYPWKWVWPVDLSPLYELPRHVDPLVTRFLVPIVALVVVTVTLVALSKRWPGGLAAWTYSAFMLLPVSGVVHAGLQLAHDRYSYLSGLGFAVLTGGALARLLRERERLKPSVMRACVVVAALVLAGWAADAWRQAKIWQDSETLWRHAREVDPHCAVCSINLGTELIAPPSNPLRAWEAEGLFRHAIGRRPDRVLAYHGLGVALAIQGRYDEAEAAFREYMERDAADATAVVDLGLLRLTQRRHAEAISFFRRALEIDPRFPGLRSDLARALRARGLELRSQGQESEADTLFAEAEPLGGEGTSPPVRQRSATTTLR